MTLLGISFTLKTMNSFSREKQAMILTLLVEGMSERAIGRAANVSPNTVSKLSVEAGNACANFHDKTVRNVKAKRVQCDEIWSFCYAKQKNVEKSKTAPKGAGDAWTWTALDSDTKLIISYEIGDRSAATAYEFMHDFDLGIFTCFENRVTPGMKDAAASTGRFMEVPRIQIYTVEDYFERRRPHLPMVA